MIDDTTLHSRQHGLIAPRLREASVLIYGAGMLGSWVAHAMTRLARSVVIWDGGDKVEDVNLGTQAYNNADKGEAKGKALMYHMDRLAYVEDLFPPSPRSLILTPDIVVACPDNMEARRAGAAWCYERDIPLFIDTRARGLEASILTVSGQDEYATYLDELPSSEDIDSVPCGESGTAFVGMFVASRVASMCNIWARDGVANLPTREAWDVERATLIRREYREVEEVVRSN